MKYSLAGHSYVQEVDNMHQQIEVAMRVAEFYSPISFLRVLLKVNRIRPYHVIQMKKNDLKDYLQQLVQDASVFQRTIYQSLST